MSMIIKKKAADLEPLSFKPPVILQFNFMVNSVVLKKKFEVYSKQ